MALHRVTRSLFLIIGLVLILAGMITYYCIQRKAVSQNLLITIIPSHDVDSQTETENLFLKWEHNFRMEFQDAVNEQTMKTLRETNQSLTDLIIRLDKRYLDSAMREVLNGKVSVLAYCNSRISISPQQQQHWRMQLTAYCDAFEKLCARPMMRYWETQYGGRDLPSDTLFLNVNSVIQNLGPVKRFLSEDGTIILHESTYSLDNLSPDELTLLIDYWFSINNRLIHSYDEVFQQSSDFLQANYVNVIPHRSK